MAHNLGTGVQSSEEQWLPLSDLFLRLHLHDPSFGLSNEQVVVSRQVHGPNLPRRKKDGQSVGFLLLDAVLWLALIAAYYAISLHQFAALGASLLLGLFLIRVVFLASAVRYMARKGSNQWGSYMVTRAGVKQQVKTEDLVPGDVVELVAGMLVPADMRLIATDSCRAITLDTFQETDKSESGDLKSPLASKEGLLETGMYVTQGKCTGVVLRTGVERQEMQGDSEDIMNKALMLTKGLWTVTVLICLSALLLSKQGLDTDSLLLLILVLYESCVPHSFPSQLCLFANSTSSHLSSNHISLSENKTLFTLGDVNCICLEAKDVLTTFEYEVTAAVVDNEPRQFENPNIEFFNGSSLSYLRILLAGILTTDDVSTPFGLQSGLLKVFKASQTRSNVHQQYPLIDRIPFKENEINYAIAQTSDSNMSIVALSGPFNQLFAMCKYVLHSGHPRNNDEETRERLIEMHHSLEIQGISLRSFAYAEVNTKMLEGSWSMDKLPLIFAGSLGLEPRILEGISEAIAECRLNSMHVLLLTSIPLQQATSVALKSNILTGVSTVQSTCVSYSDLERLPAKSMVKDLLLKPELVLAEADLAGKASVLTKLKGLGNVPVTVGFGVKLANNTALTYENSAPAARETADVVVSDGSLRAVLVATRASQHLVDCGRKLCFLNFSSWAPEVLPFILATGGLPAPLSLPLLALHKILKETVGMLAIARTAPEPVRAKSRLLSAKSQLISMCVLPCVYLFLPLLAYFATMTLCGFDPTRLAYLGTGTQPGPYDSYSPILNTKGNSHAGDSAYLQPWPLQDDYDMRLWFYRETTWQPCWRNFCYSSEALNLAQTAYFLSLSTQAIFVIFSLRSIISSCIRTPFSPILVQVALVVKLALVLAVIYLPLLNDLLGTRPLPWDLFLVSTVPGAVLTLAELELYKWRLRSRS